LTLSVIVKREKGEVGNRDHAVGSGIQRSLGGGARRRSGTPPLFDAGRTRSGSTQAVGVGHRELWGPNGVSEMGEKGMGGGEKQLLFVLQPARSNRNCWSEREYRGGGIKGGGENRIFLDRNGRPKEQDHVW